VTARRVTASTVTRREVIVGGTAAALLAGCGPAGRSASSTAPSTPAASTPAPSPTGSLLASGAATRSPAPAGTVGAGVARNSGGDVLHGPRTTAAVALTFHGAGAPSSTRRALAELADASARVTVFAVGSWLEQEPSLARAVLDGGHELGNHTYHHLPMRTLRPGQAVSEIARAALVLTRLVGDHGAWFRPSGTPSSTPTIRDAARRCGYPVCVSYDVDSLDWTDPGSTAIVQRVLAQAQPGSIVSMHLGHPGTLDALPVILSVLAGRHIRPVTVSELVG